DPPSYDTVPVIVGGGGGGGCTTAAAWHPTRSDVHTQGVTQRTGWVLIEISFSRSFADGARVRGELGLVRGRRAYPGRHQREISTGEQADRLSCQRQPGRLA